MKRIVIFGQAGLTEEATRNFILCRAVAIQAKSVAFNTTRIGFASPDASPIAKLMTALLFCPARWGILLARYFMQKDHDLIFLPYPSYIDGWLAGILAGLSGKKFIIDAFVPIYDTLVFDRRLMNPKGFLAKFVKAYEKWLLALSDRVLVDTESNGRMLEETYSMPTGKAVSVPVGIEETLWRPLPYPRTGPFEVIFWCTFIPLHGVIAVADAANILQTSHPDIRFTVIGTGQQAEEFRNHIHTLDLKNLTWINRFICLSDIYDCLRRAHCCLGVFGDRDKTHRVIPYKAYQTLAVARPLITASTRATRALFTHGEDALLIEPANPVALAKAIVYLYEHQGKAKKIALNGRRLYERALSNQVINQKIKTILGTI